MHGSSVRARARGRVKVHKARLSSDRAWSTSKPGALLAAGATRSRFVRCRSTTAPSIVSIWDRDKVQVGVLGMHRGVFQNGIELGCQPTRHHRARRPQAHKKVRSIQEIGKRAGRTAPPIVGRAASKDVDSHFGRHAVQQECVAELCISSPARPILQSFQGWSARWLGREGTQPEPRRSQPIEKAHKTGVDGVAAL